MLFIKHKSYIKNVSNYSDMEYLYNAIFLLYIFKFAQKVDEMSIYGNVPGALL